MARQRFAPDHSIVAAARFIPSTDSAWDNARIDRECAEIRKAACYTGDPYGPGDPVIHPSSGHPSIRYMSGLTRYDLDAGGIRQYIDFSAKPEVWSLRRLTVQQRGEVDHLDNSDREHEANIRAFLWGVSGLNGASSPEGEALAKLLSERPEMEGRQRNEWETKVLEALGNYSIECLGEVSTAVRRVSRDLSVEEKKPSAGPLGPG